MKNFMHAGWVVVALLLAACGGGDDNTDDPAPTAEEAPTCPTVSTVAKAFEFKTDEVTEIPSVSTDVCQYRLPTAEGQEPTEVTWTAPIDRAKLGPAPGDLERIEEFCTEQPCIGWADNPYVHVRSERDGDHTQVVTSSHVDGNGGVRSIDVFATTLVRNTDCSTWVTLNYDEPGLERYQDGVASLSKEACGV